VLSAVAGMGDDGGFGPPIIDVPGQARGSAPSPGQGLDVEAGFDSGPTFAGLGSLTPVTAAGQDPGEQAAQDPGEQAAAAGRARNGGVPVEGTPVAQGRTGEGRVAEERTGPRQTPVDEIPLPDDFGALLTGEISAGPPATDRRTRAPKEPEIPPGSGHDGWSSEPDDRLDVPGTVNDRDGTRDERGGTEESGEGGVPGGPEEDNPFATIGRGLPMSGTRDGEGSVLVHGSDREETVPRSRAGRNLGAAIAVGVGMGAAVAASLFVRKEAFVALASVAIVAGVWELAGAFSARKITVPLVPLAVGAVGTLVSAFVAGEDGLLVAFALTVFGCLLWRIIDGLNEALGDVAASLFTAAYVPFLAGFAMLMLAERDGALRIVVFILLVVSNDVGGYATGVLAGRHPMAPSVSPKKSWEGFGGSLLTGMLVGMVTVTQLLHGPWWGGAAVGAAAVVTATLGDLSESLLKRDLGIKDMGSLLPGHGGIMDRLDSLLPTAPAVYLLLELFVTAR
jgi:phosphatidate cytidylyltransferase